LAAGYAGERVVMLVGADVPRINAACEVVRGVMSEIGFALDYVAADWGTVISCITNRQATDKGGWNSYRTYWSGMDRWSPATHAFLRGNGAQATTGWPARPRIKESWARWLGAADLATQQGLARQLQAEAELEVPCVPLGVFTQPVAYRRNLTGILRSAPMFTRLRRR
jgi:peptide/nickel transport system substrate-binding protein